MRADDPLRLVMPWLDEEQERGERDEELCGERERGELIEALRELAEEEGEGVTMMRFLSESGFKEYTVYKHFDSWGELRVAAGLEPRREADVIHSDDELLAEGVRVLEECGGFPTIREFNARSRYPYHALYMRFGRREEIVRRCEEYRGRHGGQARIR
ncbi:MAG: homing endonuclease associated repeat-containing protein [Planctomycetaceae bacterium]